MKRPDPFSFGFTDLLSEGFLDRVAEFSVGNAPPDDELRSEHKKCLDNEFKDWTVLHTDDGEGAVFSRIMRPRYKYKRLGPGTWSKTPDWADFMTVKSHKKRNGEIYHETSLD